MGATSSSLLGRAWSLQAGGQAGRQEGNILRGGRRPGGLWPGARKPLAHTAGQRAQRARNRQVEPMHPSQGRAADKSEVSPNGDEEVVSAILN